MPVKSKAQNRLMQAASHTKGGFGGVSQSVGKKFTDADKGKSLKKLPEKVKPARKSKKDDGVDQMMRNGFTKGGPAT